MKVLYGFSNCSDKLYDKLFENKNVSILRPDQKYHGLILKGLVKNGVEVKAFSGLPINRSLTKKLFINCKNETENGVKYHYFKTFNLPILRQLGIAIGGFFGVLFNKKQKGETFLICDLLNISNAYGMIAAAKLKKIPVVLIVTDLPEFQFENSRTRKTVEQLFKKADGFILLTEQMNAKVNVKNKPYVVIEGQSDSEIVPIESNLKTEALTGIKEIIYAGAISSLYGLSELVNGFIKADVKDTVLKIYGDGDFAEKVKELSKTNERVKYMGLTPNREIVEDEKRAALLVNPRPIEPEYTKYSFPSKNMEYMASYTPVLTTRLPGMPKEYYDYVYTIDGSGEDGIKKAIKKVFSLSKLQRENLGKKAGEFIKNNKNNVVQTKKIVEFLREINVR